MRSKTSLVQTIGRAARHVEGRVLMYADTITESMRYAINETERRREYQQKYNSKNGITPQSVHKEIRGRLVESDEKDVTVDFDIEKMDIKQKKLLVKELERKMMIAADNLDFERAAMLRDEIKEIKVDM